MTARADVSEKAGPAHPNAVWFRDGLDALAAGDVERWAGMFADDMDLHVPAALGWSPGEARGAKAVVELWSTLIEWTDGAFQNELLACMGAEHLVVTLNRVTATRKGVSETWDTAWTYRLSDGQVVEAWLLPSLDPDHVREFWG